MLDNISKYVYEVYRLKSVSLAAKELFISQPALSSAIKKAERELGAPIFNRKTLPFSLTAEGKVYIEAIEKMLSIEKQTSEHIRNIREIKGGTLKIGTSTHLSFYVIPKILEVFHKTYPQVDINIVLTDTDKIYELLRKEMADIIFLPTENVPDGYTAVKLFEEKFVVAIPCNALESEELLRFAVSYDDLINGKYDREKEITDMSLFHGIEFIYSPPNTNIYKKRKMLFGKSEIPPYITSSVGRQQLNYNLMQAGFGALLTTDANIATMPRNSKCLYFVLAGPAAQQSFSIVYPEIYHVHPSQILKEFVTTAENLFSCENPLKQLNNE